MKLLFLPISIIGGILAGLIAKKIVEQIWGLLDDEEPPDAKHREVEYPSWQWSCYWRGRSSAWFGASLTTAPVTVLSDSPESPRSPATSPAQYLAPTSRKHLGRKASEGGEFPIWTEHPKRGGQVRRAAVLVGVSVALVGLSN
jgi:hypothetical protein